MKKELTKKQQEILHKKNLIFNTSIELFKEHGYDNVSIKDICNATGVSVGSLYNMYENKASILFQFKELFVEKCYSVLRNNMDSLDVIDTITKYILSVLEMFYYIGADMTLRLHLSHKLLFPQKSEGTELLEKYMEGLKEKNAISSSLPTLRCVEMINIIMYGFVYQWCDNEGDFDLIQNAKDDLPHMLSFLL